MPIFQNKIYSETINDHEKAIKAVNEGEILPLNEILTKITKNFNGRVISINLKDSEKGLFGWVYDIMIIDNNNNVKQLRLMQAPLLYFQSFLEKIIENFSNRR